MHSLVHRPTLVRIYSGWQYGLSMGDGGRRSRLQFICKNLKNLFYISFNLVNFSFTAYLFCRSLNFFLFSTTEILWKLFIFLFACYQNFSIVIRKRHHLLGWNRKKSTVQLSGMLLFAWSKRFKLDANLKNSHKKCCCYDYYQSYLSNGNFLFFTKISTRRIN